MNYQGTYTLSPHVGATGTWSFDSSLLPHPINFMSTTYKDTVMPNGDWAVFENNQIDGANAAFKYLSFLNIVQRWRMAYMSVSIYQDGPDLANQGSIVVAQSPVAPIQLPFCAASRTTGSPSGVWCMTESYTAEDKPDFTKSQGMPNAYFGRSRDGAYVPLKLTQTCQDWVSDANAVCPAAVVRFATTDPATTGMFHLPTDFAPVYPHWNMASACQNFGAQVAYTAAATSPMLSGAWAFISARNLAVTTSFTFFVRCGIEMQVPPSSALSPQLKLSPMHDSLALDIYFKIARELKDAYPVEYNCKGKMMGVISEAAKRLGPMLVGMPSPLMKGLGYTLQGVGGIAGARQQRKQTNKPPAPRNITIVETAPATGVRQDVEAAPPPVPDRSKKPKLVMTQTPRTNGGFVKSYTFKR
jgi:hypothetical protein